MCRRYVRAAHALAPRRRRRAARRRLDRPRRRRSRRAQRGGDTVLFRARRALDAGGPRRTRPRYCSPRRCSSVASGGLLDREPRLSRERRAAALRRDPRCYEHGADDGDAVGAGGAHRRGVVAASMPPIANSGSAAAGARRGERGETERRAVARASTACRRSGRRRRSRRRRAAAAATSSGACVETPISRRGPSSARASATANECAGQVDAVGVAGERDVDAIVDQQRGAARRASAARRRSASASSSRVVRSRSRSCTARTPPPQRGVDDVEQRPAVGLRAVGDEVDAPGGGDRRASRFRRDHG